MPVAQLTWEFVIKGPTTTKVKPGPERDSRTVFCSACCVRVPTKFTCNSAPRRPNGWEYITKPRLSYDPLTGFTYLVQYFCPTCWAGTTRSIYRKPSSRAGFEHSVPQSRPPLVKRIGREGLARPPPGRAVTSFQPGDFCTSPLRSDGPVEAITLNGVPAQGEVQSLCRFLFCEGRSCLAGVRRSTSLVPVFRSTHVCSQK